MAPVVVLVVLVVPVSMMGGRRACVEALSSSALILSMSVAMRLASLVAALAMLSSAIVMAALSIPVSET